MKQTKSVEKVSSETDVKYEIPKSPIEFQLRFLRLHTISDAESLIEVELFVISSILTLYAFPRRYIRKKSQRNRPSTH